MRLQVIQQPIVLVEEDQFLYKEFYFSHKGEFLVAAELIVLLYLIWVFYFHLAVVFKLIDASSIEIERLFSHAKRTMISDRNAMSNIYKYFEAVLLTKFNKDLFEASKKKMLKHIYFFFDW